MSFKRGDRIGRFVVEAFLGSGGMGRVYRAYDDVLERRVALKILEKEESAEASARILQEARAAAALDHPNVVSIYEVGEAGGLPYLAMEYVSGSSLRQWIGTPIAFGARMRILLDVARALASAHEARLVHRDVKPENVMIRSDGVVKVLDFGIARKNVRVDPLGATAHATAPHPVAGTIAYMAPEQMRGENVDARADQFSWSVLAFELLVGIRPWAGEGIELIAAMLSVDPEHVGQRDPTIPAPLDALIARGMSRARDARFGSMDEIVALLEPMVSTSSADVAQLASRTLDSDAARASATRTPTMASGPIRRSWRSWAFGAGVVAIGGGLLAATIALHGRAGVPPSPTAPPPQLDAAVALADVPPPKTTSAEAANAYAAAIEGTHRGALIALTVPLFRAAVRADPTLGAAHLRLAIQTAEHGDTADARAELVAAGKARLSPRDLEILDAYAPCILADPIDPIRCVDSMAPLVRAHPQDAEILFLAGLSAIYAGDLSGAIALFDRALAIDPTYGAALYLRAESIAYEGDFANARRSFAECIARAPLAESCLRWQPLLDDQEGDLAACERDARALRALGPGTVTTQRIYAEALLARGDTIESVLEVLAKEWSVTPEAERALREQRDRAALDAYQGHLDDAIKRLDRNLDAIIASSDPWRWRQDVALYLSLLEETGRAKEGGARAAKVRRRLPALDANAHGDDWSIAQDALPILVDAEFAGGVLTRAERGALREGWIRSWNGRVFGAWRAYPWVYGWAELTRTPEDAAEALSARALDAPPFRPLTATSFALGRTYLLAGDRTRAIPLLRSAASSCIALSYPVQAVRARVLLADAIAVDDHALACAAYAQAIAQWGAAKRSITVERAREGAKRAGCQ